MPKRSTKRVTTHPRNSAPLTRSTVVNLNEYSRDDAAEAEHHSPPTKRARNSGDALDVHALVVAADAVDSPDHGRKGSRLDALMAEVWLRFPGNGVFRKLPPEMVMNIMSFFDAYCASFARKTSPRFNTHGLKGVLTFIPTPKLRTMPTDNVNQVLNRFPNIVSMDLQAVLGVDDTTVSLIAKLSGARRLHTLNLSSTRITDVGLASLVAVCTSLTQLRVSHCQPVSNEGAASVARACPQLKWIDVSATAVHDNGMTELATHCPQLVFADFSWCPGTDVGLGSFARLATSIRSLRVPARASDTGVDEVSSKLTNLYSLGLVRLPVTDDALIRIGERITTLRSLHLAHCDVVSDRGLEGFAQINTGLTLFNLRNPGMLVSDRGVGYVVRNCTTLRSIKLRSCARFTNLALESIAVNAKLINNLELHTLSAVQSVSVQSVIDHCVYMRSLVIFNCQLIPPKEAADLMKAVATRPPPIFERLVSLRASAAQTAADV